jgi:hypothetical protein
MDIKIEHIIATYYLSKYKIPLDIILYIIDLAPIPDCYPLHCESCNTYFMNKDTLLRHQKNVNSICNKIKKIKNILVLHNKKSCNC